MTRALLLTLALMCENVNAAPARDADGVTAIPSAGVTAKEQSGAAPFTLSNPLCQTGFWIKQRVDDRDRNGAIIKSRWVFGCAKGKIIYGTHRKMGNLGTDGEKRTLAKSERMRVVDVRYAG